jgi:uncharacterized protein YndB with AHSA1/START domain
LTPHLSGLWLALVTPAQARVGRALVEGLKNPTVVTSSAAFDAFQIEPTPLRVALAKAIEGGARLRQKFDTRTTVLDAPPSQVFSPIRQIGGTNGWYFGNSLWRARGWLDLGFGGVGMGRGRRDPENCGLTDVIDGWTVEAYEPDRRLRLRADLKLPGSGWLEFQVTPLDDGRRSLIRQTATFDPRGLLGRAYWYVLLPVHEWMFSGLLHEIARRAKLRPGTRRSTCLATSGRCSTARAGPTCSLSSRTTGAGVCRWCRSRRSPITSGAAGCRIWPTRSICSRIRSS